MTSLSDGMLRARPQGARLKRLQALTPPVINPTCLSTKIWSLQIMSFTVQQSYRVFPPAWPWNGQINSSFETNWNYTPRCLNVRMCERWCPRSHCRWNVKIWEIQGREGGGVKTCRTPHAQGVKPVLSMESSSYCLSKGKIGSVPSSALRGKSGSSEIWDWMMAGTPTWC